MGLPKEKDIFDKNGLPNEEGRYLIECPWSVRGEPIEVDVYYHPIKGLCIFADDILSSGTEGVDDATDCHVSV